MAEQLFERKLTVTLKRNVNEMLGKSWLSLQKNESRRDTGKNISPNETIIQLDSQIKESIDDLEQIIHNTVNRKKNQVLESH